MKKPPETTGSTSLHYYQANTDHFAVCVDKLENASDADALASRTQCAGYGGSTGYCVCSD
jgi:hypothetical protein